MTDTTDKKKARLPRIGSAKASGHPCARPNTDDIDFYHHEGQEVCCWCGVPRSDHHSRTRRGH